ncbi:K02A2.6-like [Cordylochernes scorpioides]|uniref:K02A2.6-like n=1 Tax=Cordylochernes scorpioides TaxID=51811 RepID=A0ABY6K3W5_9ARAC|nr:K02A2.6-like [Cordylochernes scorpioides]
MEAARAFLEMHQRDGDQVFSRIVIGDESWVHLSTPETKQQSMVWKKPEESAPKKAKVTISAGKVMAMENFKWEIFTHPPYSPELAPSDFHLYPALKWHLRGKHFANDEVQAEANLWLRRQDTAWYNSDNGRQFVFGEFEQFTKMNGIRHIKTSPYNPSTNGLAERYVREFKNLLRNNNGKDDLETNLQRFLFAHRAFPQTVIKEFPGGTANEEKFKIKILEFNTKMGNPREVFHEAKMDQKSGEAISKYIIRLKEQAQRCNFGDVLQESLRDRFVAGIIDTPTQKKLLQEEGLTFEGALDIALSAESADNDLHNLKRSEDAHLSPQHLHAINNPCKHCATFTFFHALCVNISGCVNKLPYFGFFLKTSAVYNPLFDKGNVKPIRVSLQNLSFNIFQ